MTSDTEPGLREFLYEHRPYIATFAVTMAIVGFTGFQYGQEGLEQLMFLASMAAVALMFLSAPVLYYGLWKEEQKNEQ